MTASHPDSFATGFGGMWQMLIMLVHISGIMNGRSVRELKQTDMPAVRNIFQQFTEKAWWGDAIDRIRRWISDPECICIAVESADNTVIAFAVGIVYQSDTTPDEFAVTSPGKVDYPDGPLLLLKHNYVHEEYHGQGIGTQLIRYRVRWAIAEYEITAVFCECWVKEKYTSSDELLEKLEFTEAWYDDDYYEEYNQSTSGVCSGCEQRLSNCQCGGAIYLHRNPVDI